VERKSTRFWKLSSLVLLLGGALAGCDPSGLALNQGETDTLTASDVKLTSAHLSCDLAILAEESVIRIGQKHDSAMVGDFRAPARSVKLSELPPMFDESFGAAGWETPTRTVSLVTSDGNVVLALDMNEALDAAPVNEMIEKYRGNFGVPSSSVKTEHSEYLFWERQGVRLMLCIYRQKEKPATVTKALGLTTLMDRLRMDAGSAQRDSASAETLLNPRIENNATDGAPSASE